MTDIVKAMCMLREMESKDVTLTGFRLFFEGWYIVSYYHRTDSLFLDLFCFETSPNRTAEENSKIFEYLGEFEISQIL